MFLEQEPYSRAQCEKALSNHGTYVAGINVFWINHLRSPSPGVPLKRHSVKALADFLWPQESTEPPAFLLKIVECGAPVGVVPEIPSGLHMLSPEGYVHALLAACARDLPRNKEQWMVVLKSVPAAFTVGPDGATGGDTWIRAWNVRNEISQAYESLSRTAWQMCLEIQGVKRKLEADLSSTLQPAELVKELHKRGLKRASNQDELSGNLINWAILIAERVSGDDMLGPLDTLEEKYGSKSCFNKMAVLHALVSKPRTCYRVWCWQTLFHMLETGQVANEDVTKRFLLGDSHSPGNIGVWELKAMVLEHLLTYLLAKAKLVEKDLVVLRSAFSSHSSYRKHMLGGEVGWQGQLSPSSLEALNFVEARFFDNNTFRIS